MNVKNLDYALQYAAMGWFVFPTYKINPDLKCACGNPLCKSPGKHPIRLATPKGQDDATTDPDIIRGWWKRYPDANIAISLMPSSLVAIDIDPRNGGWETIDALEHKHGPIQSDVLALTGGGGEHRVFTLAKDSQLALPGKLGDGIDVKRNGYIIAEPSNHESGKRYEWEASSNPLEGISPSPLPDFIRDLGHESRKYELAPVTTVPMGDTLRRDLVAALETMPGDDREEWLQVGMALHSTNTGNDAFELWCDWSYKSPKFSLVDQYRTWRSFRNRGLSGVSHNTIFHIASTQYGWENKPAVKEADPIDFSSVAIAQHTKIDQPVNLLRPPGIMADVFHWIHATSQKPQPQFALQAAIGFMSTIIGRRYTTNKRNFPTLYLLNIGKSASGKEHAKNAIEDALEECGCGHLIGPQFYSSNSGLLSTLMKQPSHISIVDEFGKVLENASVKNNALAKGVMTALMESFGRCHGVMRAQGYSDFGGKHRPVEKKEAIVRNPALALLAMTTPETFFDSIGSAAVKDGFLNRFLIVESDIGRQLSVDASHDPLPQNIIEWSQRARERPEGGELVDPDGMPDMTPVFHTIGIHPGAMKLFNEFEKTLLAKMDEYEKDGLSEMFGRTREISMRLALIVAVGCDSKLVMADHAQWAIDYCMYYAIKTVERLKFSVADSDFDSVRKAVMDKLMKAGERGLTLRELCRKCRKFNLVKRRDQDEVLGSLQRMGAAQEMEMKNTTGPARKAWVALKDLD